MDKKTRTYEEIITLQDKAIEALTQANAALVMALEALKKARAEHGFTTQLPGLGVTYTPTNPVINPAFIPNTVPMIQWNSDGSVTTLTNTAGLQAKTVTAQNLVTQANVQKTQAQAYLAAYQKFVKESDAEMGEHVSLCQSGDE